MSATQYAGPKGNNKSTGTVTATLPDGTVFSGSIGDYQHPHTNQLGFFYAKSANREIVISFPKALRPIDKKYTYPDQDINIQWDYRVDGKVYAATKGKVLLQVDDEANAQGTFEFSIEGGQIKDGKFKITNGK
ncbi:hypothetical protein AQS70_02615 [Pseudomonas endophytica]|uniref:Uncharacterized protein n=1 Tax=Pseudomonas endophytica TaxID=1563157 RepID=A0A0Q0SN82_9PSED|nr:hypothetical protein [Pseudomonas endophytica]KQB53093.1 hypothetical protein AQS70_02615 [Pseudomonas endophytica]